MSKKLDSGISKEDLQKLEKLVEKTGAIESYSVIITQLSKSLENIFAATERGMDMTKTVHEMQIKGVDNWFDLAKFLLPFFVTVFTAGLTINVPNFNQFVSIWLGGTSSLIILGIMFRLSYIRGKMINNQTKDMEKLRNLFDDYQKMFKFQNTIGLESSGLSEEKINEISKEMLEMVGKYNQGDTK